MNTLKLNQLNKQKVAEREMKGIEGGLSAQYENEEAVINCGSSCNDAQFIYHPVHDYHVAWGFSAFALI